MSGSSAPLGTRPSTAPAASDPLFTPRFFVMCGFSFTVFLSAFQLLPTTPFRIRELGGSTSASGLFLGFLTYASASSAPVTGRIADRIGRRLMLLIASTVVCICSIGYAVTASVSVMLALVVVHGFFWSGLLSASSAYLTSLVPERRRAEGISYWGLSSIAAVAVAPPVAFWILQQGGWRWICYSCIALNALMGVIAWTLDEPTVDARDRQSGPFVEWRVLLLSGSLFLYTFGYGAITSFTAVYADAIGVTPKSIYLTTLAVRCCAPAAVGRAHGSHRSPPRVPTVPHDDRGGTRAARRTRLATLVGSAIVRPRLRHGISVFIAYVPRHRRPRRSAASAILATFDTGIGPDRRRPAG